MGEDREATTGMSVSFVHVELSVVPSTWYAESIRLSLTHGSCVVCTMSAI